MKIPRIIARCALLPCLITGAALAARDDQEDLPLIRPEERTAIDDQSRAFNDTLAPLIADAARSTVRIWLDGERLAYGTVTGDGRTVITKFSELADPLESTFVIEPGEGPSRMGVVAGVYEDDDLAVLRIDGDPLPAVRWTMALLPLGSFLAAPQPDGDLAAFGVVAVEERLLKDAGSGGLGVRVDPRFTGSGVRIASVEPDGGAAQAGLLQGDILTRIDGRDLSGFMELKHVLSGKQPGSKVAVVATRDGVEAAYEVILGKLPEAPKLKSDRIRITERLGGSLSRVRDDFSRVIQSDMRPKPNQIGGPVVNLKGEVVGVTIARADRTRSFILPAARIQELLASSAGDPAAALARAEAGKGPAFTTELPEPPQGRMGRIRMKDMQGHVDELRQLMDFLRDELDQLEKR
ncbi:MAG: PDZ domain-containing protein [Verrucomicrobia bacterium]|nr:PDZ domain-containing protein [Verrucomicrobiota bacterium]